MGKQVGKVLNIFDSDIGKELLLCDVYAAPKNLFDSMISFVKISGGEFHKSQREWADDVKNIVSHFLWSELRGRAFYLGTGVKRPVGSKAEPRGYS